MKMRISIIAAASMLLLSACSVESGFDTTTPPDKMDEVPNLVPAAGQAVVLTTTADSSYTLSETQAQLSSGTNMAPTTIQFDPNTHYQTMDGFGFALTYSSAYNLLQMPQEERVKFLTRTFSPTQGYGVSYLRISIGCSDFSSRVYTLCDRKGLENFALQSDETDYVIPVLKEIIAINPQLKVIASPWTCPRWMKVTDINTKTVYDGWTDGHLNPDYRQDYADYFVRFIQAMQGEGINIYAVTPQNEPLNRGNCASLYMPWDEEADFVKVLAQTFHKNGLKTLIYLYDHNYDYAGISSQSEYPLKIYKKLGNDFEGADLIAGAAYHDYGGTNAELTNMYNKEPDKGLIFSEASIGTWNKGNQLKETLMIVMRDMMLGTINKMSKAVIVWNLMLDSNRGPNLDGGCQTCFGAVDIDKVNYRTIKYNCHYFVICQTSAVVEPGAVRVGVKRDTENTNLIHSEFVNPDGTYASILCNLGDEAQPVTLHDGTSFFQVTVPAQGIVSAKWGK